MTLEGFEPAITASERPQTHALDRAVTGISPKYYPRPYCHNLLSIEVNLPVHTKKAYEGMEVQIHWLF